MIWGETPLFSETPQILVHLLLRFTSPHGPRWGPRRASGRGSVAASSMTVTDHWSCEPAGQAWQTSPRLGSNSNNSEEFLDFKGNQNANIPNFFQGRLLLSGWFCWILQKMFLIFFRGFLFSCLFSAEKIGVQSVHCQFPQFWMEKLWLFLADEFMMYTWFPFQVSRNTSCVALHRCLIGKPTSSSSVPPSSQSNKKKLEIPSQNKKYHGHPWTMNVQKSRAKNVSEFLKILFHKPSPFHPTSFCWSLAVV